MASVQGELDDFVLAEYNANPSFIEGLIAKGEGALQSFLVKVFSNVKVGGIAGLILPEIEGGVEKYVANLIATNTTQQIYTIVGTWLAAEAKSLGG